MSRILPFLVTLCSCALAAFAPVSGVAQTPNAPAPVSSQSTVRVATRVLPPFVIQGENKQFTGFSIDLWNAIGKELGIKSEYVATGTVKDLLATVQTKKVDLGISAISVTSERQKVLEFSQPMFDAGLQILVRDDSKGDSTPSILQILFSPAMRQAMLIVALLILIPAHIVWFAERNREDGIIEHARYFPGIFKAIWWAAGTLGAQADEMPRSPVGRVVAIFWMFTGIAFIAYFTAIITASMTVQQLQGDINGPDDLPGRRIATVAGSTSQMYLEELGLRPQTYAQFAVAAKELEAGRVQAVVFDAPVLLFYSANDKKAATHVVGPIFRKENYGIVFPPGSPWRRPVNDALLKLKERGDYERIYAKWFDDEQEEGIVKQ